MAEIPVERKSGGMKWLWIILAIILVVLLIWWATSGDDEAEVVTTGVETEQVVSPVQEGIAGDQMTIAAILANPEAYVGRDDFQAEVAVPEVPTDRGFWVENEGQRLFALIVDEPREVPLDINAGQDLRVTNGMLRDATYLGELPGVPIDDDTRRIIEEQDVFLVVNEENIEILSRP